MANMSSIVFSLALVLSIQFVAGQDEQATGELSLIEAVVENAKEIDPKLAAVNTNDIKSMGEEIQKTLESSGVNDKDLDAALTLEQVENSIENGPFVISVTMGGVGATGPDVAEEIAPSPEILPQLAEDTADVPDEVVE